ncbi:MAG: nicotinate (nicotinamide) nucleotide adenylyltransferase [Opitutae bacterium]|nr:nicotinate (nicotinamide) nucleotide adenylyltransferase [Opitutae bacterium]|tara:strand:+ start:2586 stop:3206 length:621 start_codon:yes stop_codon:yes gene_type:complete
MLSSPTPTTGIFGGSFDPIHLGHLILARDVLEQLSLQRMLFVPASRSPLSECSPIASGKDRLDLLRASLVDDPAFAISDLEIQAGGINYTIDTAEALRAEYPDDHFVMIIGGDQLEQLHKWKRARELTASIDFVCLERKGFELKVHADLVAFRSHPIKPRIMEVSSTEIRQRIHRNLSVRHLVPEPAMQIIRERGLYGARSRDSNV